MTEHSLDGDSTASAGSNEVPAPAEERLATPSWQVLSPSW
jgi:hypothetical protein